MLIALLVFGRYLRRYLQNGDRRSAADSRSKRQAHGQVGKVTILLAVLTVGAGSLVVNATGSEMAGAAERLAEQAYLPRVVDNSIGDPCPPVAPDRPVSAESARLEGTRVKWHLLTLAFTGPTAVESDEAPNPFLDFRLDVTFVAPSGRQYRVPGFFNGDGEGGGAGDQWHVRFAPDEVGEWRYCTSFRAAPRIAVFLTPDAGMPVFFDGALGEFEVRPLDPDAPGFLRWGRLEYDGTHYLKFRDGPYWIKGGINSPENFFGYHGFDNTVDHGGIVGGFRHAYPGHVADWQPGDPDFVSADTGENARGIIGALNYLAAEHVNSIYFLPMNLGGDGQETYPFVNGDGSVFANTHYDISKLHQWQKVLAHGQAKGIAWHVVLNETEWSNRMWLDGGVLGTERRLFYREMIARFSYLLALKWNVSEENRFSVEQLVEFADYIQALDWAGHAVAVHTHPNNFADYEFIVGDPRFSATSIQYGPDFAGDYVETWRARSAEHGRPWVIDMDENNPASDGLTPDNIDDLRKRVLYDVYFSGGQIEWYAGYHPLPVGGDMRLENFRTREPMWRYMWYGRRFMSDNLPFWEMGPADGRLVGESADYGGGQVLAGEGVFAVYLPDASPAGSLQVGAGTPAYLRRWYDPRHGLFVGEAEFVTVVGGWVPLGEPPAEPDEDWIVLIQTIGSVAPDAAR